MAFGEFFFRNVADSPEFIDRASRTDIDSYNITPWNQALSVVCSYSYIYDSGYFLLD